MGDAGTHAARLGQCQRFAIVGFGALGIEPIGMARDVAQQLQSLA